MFRLIFAAVVTLSASAALAQPHWGNYPDGGALPFWTNTVGTDGVAETISSEDVGCMKDGTGSDIGGITFDDDANGTGNHKILVDTTDSDYTTGSFYTLYHKAGTVDGVSIAGRIIGSFYLGPKDANVTQNAGTAITATSGIQAVNVTKFGGTDGTFASGIPAVNGVQISGDSGAADNLEAGFDGTGYKANLSIANVRNGYNNVLEVGSGLTYTTLPAAKTAAAAGDLVVVHPGTHDVAAADVNLLKDGVDWHFMPGATVTCDDDNTSTRAFFDDVGSAVRSNITGEGVFVQGHASNTGEEIVGLVDQSHANSRITLRAKSFTALSPTAVGAYAARCSAGKQDVAVDYAVGTGDGLFECSGTGTQTVRTIEASGSQQVALCTGGKQVVHAVKLSASADTVMCMTGTTQEQSIDADEIAGGNDLITCVSGYQHVKVGFINGSAIYHGGGTQFVEFARQDKGSEDSAVEITGSTGTCRLTGGRSNGSIMWTTGTTGTVVELVGGTWGDGTASTSAEAARTLYVLGEVFLNGAQDGDVTISWRTPQLAIGKVGTDAIDAAAAATTLIDEIQANLAVNGVKLTSTGLENVNSEVDTALGDYGALKPTTPGRTLDVDAEGAAESNLTKAINTALTEPSGGRFAGNFASFFNNENAATSQVVDDVGGDGDGGTDWTATERNQMRYMWGIDGTKSAPASSTPALLAQSHFDDTIGNLDTFDDLVDSNPDLQAMLADTNELQTDLANGGVREALLPYFQLLMRKDAAIKADVAARLAEINANEGSGAGAYDNVTDAGQALRDRGDAAWITGAGGDGASMPVNMTAVAKNRTFILKPTKRGLVGEVPIGVKLTEDGKCLAIDFACDLATNGRLVDINSVEVIAGDEDGVEFGDDIEDHDYYGVQFTKAIVRMNMIEPGQYTIRVSADADNTNGGAPLVGDVVLVINQ